jgi:hypothetical protein
MRIKRNCIWCGRRVHADISIISHVVDVEAAEVLEEVLVGE